MNVFLGLVKSHIVLIVAVLAAAVTCFFVHPDAGYADYFDLDTLSCLFCTLAVVSALKERKFFEWLAGKIVTAFRQYAPRLIRPCVRHLFRFHDHGERHGARHLPAAGLLRAVLVRQAGVHHSEIARGMLTPFGNPQNLYLYSYYSIAAGEFFKIMALPFAVAFVLIALTCLFVKPVHVELETPETAAPPAWRMVVYFVLFALSVLIVFRVFPFYVGLIVVTVALLILEPKAFLHVDYALLLTFCAFFVFSGNLSRIPTVQSTLGHFVALSPLLVGTASCQVISNVPSAVLLSRFTTDYRHLLVAVNIGGLGTPVSSLASLITLGEYRRREPGKTGRYLALFSLVNFLFLAVLIGASYLNDLIL